MIFSFKERPEDVEQPEVAEDQNLRKGAINFLHAAYNINRYQSYTG